MKAELGLAQGLGCRVGCGLVLSPEILGEGTLGGREAELARRGSRQGGWG